MSSELSDADSAPGSQRLDKWLWFARFVKTRTLAATMIAGGKVRVNRERVIKPAQIVRVGDVLTIVITRQVQLVRVKAFAERRGPSAAARLLYEELTVEGDAIKPQSPASPDGTVRPAFEVAPVQRPAGSGRPTKKERREIDKFHGKSR